MSKAYTEDDFYFQLNQDFNWRLKEISSLKTSIIRSSTVDKPVLLRSIVTIIYAHWEGHVKFCANKYFEHITLKKLPFENLSKQIYRNYFLPRLAEVANSNMSVFQKCDLIDLIIDSLDKRFSRINQNLIDTGSNLNISVLQKICLICDVDFKSFADDEDFIDRIILKRRNSIAHGEETYIDVDELDEIAAKSIDLMRRFRDELQNNVALQKYLSPQS